MKRIVVYFKELPGSLLDHINKDKFLTFTKDGVGKCNGIACPRGIITMDLLNDHRDDDRTLKLTNLLETLSRNNQIFSYRTIR